MKIAYVGSRTTKERKARGLGLKVYSINEADRKWEQIQLVETEPNPSYQTIDITKKFLYSVHGDINIISSYKILSDGSLEKINNITIEGYNPVYITVNKTNHYIIVACLQNGVIFVIKRNDDGSLGEIVNEIKYEGKTNNSISFIHQCIWDQEMQFIFAPAQGRVQGFAQTRVFRFNDNSGELLQTDQIFSREYAEPRHVAIHNNNRFVYLINEKDNTITFHSFDCNTGKLKPLQILSTLPETYTGEGQASAISVDPSGNYLIASNRIHNSLVVYRIDQNTGYLHLQNFTDTLGKTPRFATFDDSGEYFYVANEESDSIIEMNLNLNSGELKASGQIINTGSPVCITFLTQKDAS